MDPLGRIRLQRRCRHCLSLSGYRPLLVCLLPRLSRITLTFNRPVQAYWVFPIVKNAKCLDEAVTSLAVGILNCIADLLVTVLPIPIALTLNMPLKQRIGVCILLSLGFIVTIAGVLRTYFIWKTFRTAYDETWVCFEISSIHESQC
jgi:hypothetical protein